MRNSGFEWFSTNFRINQSQVPTNQLRYFQMEKIELPPPRTRCDYRFIGKSQRQRFFYCLKFLSVLPPQEQGNLRKFYVPVEVQVQGSNQVVIYQEISPKNIHDQLISSHQTCCQHGSIYFAYYHRHLMICLQIALNYAEEVLIGGKQSVPGGLYDKHSKQFDDVFASYAQIISSLRTELGLSATAQIPQVSAHYWNPTDYTENISIPEELKERTPDPMDRLYYAVNSHYAWNFNFAYRWFGHNDDLPSSFQTIRYFLSTQAKYSDDENKIVNGTLTPRSDATEFFKVNTFDSRGYTKIYTTASDINRYNNYLKLDETGTTINVLTLDQNEINTVFGSKAKDLHWISKGQRSRMSDQDSSSAFTYNKSLPHYQFTYALYKQSNKFINDYVCTASGNRENSMENSHNTMHNMLQYFMKDSQLSITNPLFFLYHGWIDYQLQVKIRMITTDPVKNKQQYENTQSYLDQRDKPFSVLDQVSGTSPIKYGDYYIFEWVKPAAKTHPGTVLTANDYQVAFKSRNFFINDDNQTIRRSDQLTSLYKTEYLPNNAKRYAYFKNFDKFIFDHNYVINDYNGNGSRVAVQMKDNLVVVPSYLTAIYNDYNHDWNGNLTSFAPTLVTTQALKAEETQRKNATREIRMQLGVYATYSSLIQSTIAPIQLKLTEKGQKFFQLPKKYEAYLKKGLVLSIASLFSKGLASTICPNCKDEKELYILGSQKLAEFSSELFCGISKKLTQKTFFKIKDKQVEPIQNLKLNDLLTLSAPPQVFNRLQLIQGAIAADFIVQSKGKESNQRLTIALALHSYSIKTNKLENIVTKKKQAQDGTTFQFPRVFGAQEGQQRSQYYYRHVEGVIASGEEKVKFSFDINARYKLITFLINVQEKFDNSNKRYLDVQIVDRDYGHKYQHLNFEEAVIAH